MPQTLSSNKMALHLRDDPTCVAALFIPPDPVSLVDQAEQVLIVRTPTAASDPMILTAEACHWRDERLHLEFVDARCRAIMEIAIDGASLCFSLRVRAEKPIWMVEWRLSGLLCDEMILPALGGQAVTSEMPDGVELSFKYPFWLNAQFAIGMRGTTGFLLGSRDTSPDLKIVRIGKENGRFTITFGFEAPAPLNSKTLECTWYLTGFHGTWQQGVAIHKAWMEKAFDLGRLDRQSLQPAWARQINFILEIWGGRKGSRQALHTFDQMRARLREFKALHAPQQTLLYLPGFANNGVDSRAPDYTPGALMGGPEEIQRAHRRGASAGIQGHGAHQCAGHDL